MGTIITILIILGVSGTALFLFKQWVAAKQARPEFSEEECERYYEAKKAALERVLGPMHDNVGHALIPFQLGGAMDMYFFPNGIPGTGFATMELIEPDGCGPKPNRIGTYELVAFTKQTMPSPSDDSEDHPFSQIESRLCGLLTTIGAYSYDAVLKPGETAEGPGPEGEPNICLIFDNYAPDGTPFEINGKKHCLLLLIEVFRSEMEYARMKGTAAVLSKLKEAGHYPYSDLNRTPVC